MLQMHHLVRSQMESSKSWKLKKAFLPQKLKASVEVAQKNRPECFQETLKLPSTDLYVTKKVREPENIIVEHE